MRQPGDESFIRIIGFDRPSDVDLFIYKLKKKENMFVYVLNAIVEASRCR